MSGSGHKLYCFRSETCLLKKVKIPYQLSYNLFVALFGTISVIYDSEHKK
jgi:hypothetical protein